jgi:hypothetical protein
MEAFQRHDIVVSETPLLCRCVGGDTAPVLAIPSIIVQDVAVYHWMHWAFICHGWKLTAGQITFLRCFPIYTAFIGSSSLKLGSCI